MLLHWIISHVFSAIALAGAAGVGLADLGSATESADLTGTETADTGTEVTESTETGEDGTESVEEGTETEGQQTQPNKEAKIDWRTVPPEVKGHIKELAKTNPALANKIQNAVYTSNTMLKEFPGGLKEVQAFKQTIEEFGGIEEMQSLRQNYTQVMEEQEALDTKARNGDREVLDHLVDVAGTEGFGKLMPNALSKWQTMDPATYNHVMSQVIVQTLKDNQVVSDITMAFNFLSLGTREAVKKAEEALKRVGNWANGVNKVATTTPQKPAVDPNIVSQQTQLDEQKAQLFNKEFGQNFGSWRNTRIQDEVRQISNGRQLNEYQAKTLGERVVSDMQSILTSDTQYMAKLQKIYASRNMAELLKFTKSRTDKLLPEVTKKAYRTLFSDPTKKPTIVKKPVVAAKPGEAAAAPVVKGWTKIDPSKAPSPTEIDSKLSDFNMKFRQQAILKDGRKVYWGKHVPTA